MRTALLGLLLAGCGLSPRAYCDEVAAVTCEKLYSCATTQAERDALTSRFGDQKSCTSLLREGADCATLEAQRVCGNLKWNAGNALKCTDEIRALTCEGAAMFRPTCASPCQ